MSTETAAQEQSIDVRPTEEQYRQLFDVYAASEQRPNTQRLEWDELGKFQSAFRAAFDAAFQMAREGYEPAAKKLKVHAPGVLASKLGAAVDPSVVSSQAGFAIV